jgi:ferredoxin
MDEQIQTKMSPRYVLFTETSLVPDPQRCIQCGICSYHCPIDIDVRRFAWLGMPITDRHCMSCGECVERCPRGVLRFERTRSFDKISSLFARG